MKYQVLTGLGVMCAMTPAVAGQGSVSAGAGERPNIVIIYTDDMGVGDVGFLNNGWLKTPNLDRLASQGLVLTNYYSAAPVSSASRTGITTGMFPLQWGINTFLNDRGYNARVEQLDYLDPAAPSMARVLRSAGYATGHFGKWHMGGGRDVDDAPPITAYGFDEYASTWESPDPDPAITGDPTWIWSAADSVKRWNRTAYFIDKTVDFLSRHKDQPCFVNLWPDDVHTPWVPDEESQDSRKGFNSRPNLEKVMEEYDGQIGRFMAELERLGIDSNTIVIFTSDNGPAPSFEQLRTNGLRGTKNSLYEGGIKMPFVIRWPDRIAAGGRDGVSVVCAVDLLPSLASIAGARLPGGFEFSGKDVSGVFLGKVAKRRGKSLMWDFGRNEHYNKPAGSEGNRSPHLAVRNGDWKLLMNADGSSVELYNLALDPDETTDVAAGNARRVSKMRRELLEYWNTRKLRR